VKYWLIVNISEADDWNHGMDMVLADKHRPKYLHAERDQAESELLRLRKTTGDEYLLFEAVAFAPKIGDLIFPHEVFQVQPIET